MRLEAKKYLYDIQQAATLIAGFTAGKQFADYARDAMLRAAVERGFEIIGEALAQLARLDDTLAARISEHRRIIAFRNILISRFPLPFVGEGQGEGMTTRSKESEHCV